MKTEKYPICNKCLDEKNVIRWCKRYSKKGITQVYRCKNCNKCFTPYDGFRCMKKDKLIISEALSMHANGMSLSGVSRHLEQYRGVKVTRWGIRYWVRVYSKSIRTYLESMKIPVEKIACDETKIKMKGKLKYNLWNVVDLKSRFWIASYLSKHWTQDDAEIVPVLIKNAITNDPDFIFTDGARHYIKAFEDGFPNSKHIVYTAYSKHFNKHILNRYFFRMERRNGGIKQRTKVMRSLSNLKTANEIIDMLWIDYNFVKPNLSLKGRTPAEACGIDLGLGQNRWLGLIERSAMFHLSNNVSAS